MSMRHYPQVHDYMIPLIITLLTSWVHVKMWRECGVSHSSIHKTFKFKNWSEYGLGISYMASRVDKYVLCKLESAFRFRRFKSNVVENIVHNKELQRKVWCYIDLTKSYSIASNCMLSKISFTYLIFHKFTYSYNNTNTNSKLLPVSFYLLHNRQVQIPYKINRCNLNFAL